MGDDDGLWGLQEHLTAAAVDELRVANWQRANEGVKKGQQSPRPKPLPRPGVGNRRTQRTDRDSSERQAKRAAALERAEARKRAIAAGEIR